MGMVPLISSTVTAWAGPWGVSFASNLTPDTNTGIGIWTEDIFLRAMRTGRHTIPELIDDLRKTCNRLPRRIQVMEICGTHTVSLFRTGVLEGKRVREHLTQLLGNKTFGQTRIPLRVMAVDLDTCEELALGQGSLVDAVRATVSLPGLFCPAEWQGPGGRT